jgi:hypothetical protein
MRVRRVRESSAKKFLLIGTGHQRRPGAVLENIRDGKIAIAARLAARFRQFSPSWVF